MTEEKTIFEITRNSRVIYYPELAYFLPEYDKLSSVEEESSFVREHRQRLTLLSLYFDLVLIPPEHFVRTHIASQIYEDSVLRPLFDAGILMTTYWEQINDATSFIECLQAYLAGINQGHVLREPNTQQFKAIKFFLRDVTGQSQWLKDTLMVFVRNNKALIDGKYGSKMFEKIASLIGRSCYKDIIPFSHEKFGELIRQARGIPDELKKQIWDISCSYYLDAGVTANYCLRYPIVEIDHSRGNRLKYDNIYAIFFHPRFLELFLYALGVSQRTISSLEKLRPDQILTLREPQSPWLPLKTAYFDMVASISKDLEKVELEYSRSVADLSDLDKARQLFRTKLLSTKFSHGVDVLDAIVTLLVDGVSILTEIPGVAYVAERIKLKEKVKDQLIRFRQQGLSEFIKYMSHVQR